MRFRSKIDNGLAALLAASAAAVLAAVPSLVPTTTGLGWLGPVVLTAVGAGLPLWVLGSTAYHLSGTTLVVRSGPFSWRVPLSDVTRVAPTRSASASPALSLDRLRIEYGAGKALLVSPLDQDGFLRALHLSCLKARPGSAVDWATPPEGVPSPKP